MEPLEPMPSSDTPRPQPPQAASDGAAIEQAQRWVFGPAIGLLVVGMFNCLTIPAVVFVLCPVLCGRMEPAPASPPAGPTILEILAAVVVICVFVFVTVLPGAFMILAAVKMRWLKAYWLAVIASVMAILTSPAGFCLGLPIGIWALVVLSQSNVRTAFGRPPPTDPEQSALAGPERGTAMDTTPSPKTVRKTAFTWVKAGVAIAIVVLFAFLGCLAMREAAYLWRESRIPKKGTVAAIERTYRSQLDRLAEYAYDHDRFAGHSCPEGEDVARLFADAAIVEATVHGGNPPGNGFVVKSRERWTAPSSCWFYLSPSVGKPVVNLWTCDGRQYVEYCASLMDREGTERSYTIKLELSKMADADP